MMARTTRYIVAIVALLFVVACGKEADKLSPMTPSPTATSALTESKQLPTAQADNSTTTQVPTLPADASQYDTDGDGFMNREELILAIQAATGDYEFAEGFVPDLSFEATDTSDESDGGVSIVDRFEVGMQYSTLDRAFTCSWYLYYLQALNTNDVPAQQHALSRMTTDIPALRSLSPESSAATVEIATKASLGDVALLVNYVEVNCGQVKWLMAPPLPAVLVRGGNNDLIERAAGGR